MYLLGAGEGTLSLITEIEDKPSIDALRLEASRQQLQPKSFSQLMTAFFTKTPARDSERNVNTPEQFPDVGFDFLHQQRKKLRKL